MAQPAGVGDAAPESVIAGVLDIVRTGEGPEASKAWAKGCALTGDCITACDEAVNPRFLLAMARVALAKHSSELRNRRKQGVENFRLVADGVNVLARMQLSENELARLGQHVNERLENGSTAIWDANRYNEVESASPRYTFGQLRIDAMGGHITLDTGANLRVKPLGESGFDIDYPHRDVNFAGDCVYALQRHFVDAMRSGGAFESEGEDYLKTLAAVEAIYESARIGGVVRLQPYGAGRTA